MEKNNGQQEMDLLLLIRKIFDFSCNVFKKIAGFFGYLLQIIFRYYYLFLIFILAAVAYSYYKTHGHFRVYRAEFTLSINDGDSDLYKEMVSSLSNYLKDEDPSALASALKMDPAEGGKICAIGIRCDIEPIDSTSRAVLAVIMTDPAIFPALENAIIDYFNNNIYLKSLNSARIASLKEHEKLLEKDIAEIDSLQKIEYFQKTGEIGFKLDQKLLIKADKQMFYSDKLDLLKEKEAVSKELAAKPDVVSLVSEFAPSTKPFIRMSDVIVLNIIIAFLCFLAVAISWENRKSIISYLKKK